MKKIFSILMAIALFATLSFAQAASTDTKTEKAEAKKEMKAEKKAAKKEAKAEKKASKKSKKAEKKAEKTEGDTK